MPGTTIGRMIALCTLAMFCHPMRLAPNAPKANGKLMLKVLMLISWISLIAVRLDSWVSMTDLIVFMTMAPPAIRAREVVVPVFVDLLSHCASTICETMMAVAAGLAAWLTIPAVPTTACLIMSIWGVAEGILGSIHATRVATAPQIMCFIFMGQL